MIKEQVGQGRALTRVRLCRVRKAREKGAAERRSEVHGKRPDAQCVEQRQERTS